MFQFLSRNSVRWDDSCVSSTARPPLRFNSSVGILSVGTDGAEVGEGVHTRFNSSVGILSVGTTMAPAQVDVEWNCFNSSVGILSVGTTLIPPAPGSMPMFQFLSRNSVRWDLLGSRLDGDWGQSFNSSVGILSVGTMMMGLPI